MGLISKLKNALFEEEEIEEKVPEKVVVPKEVDHSEIEETREVYPESERDLFKAENTFNFPDFDEEEFDTSYEAPKKEKETEEIPSILRQFKEEKEKVNNIEEEKRSKPVRERETRRLKSATIEGMGRAFRPSPIISPVYGVLEKNTKNKEKPLEERIAPKKTIDVDLVRKKAFGTLEDDIEKTLNEPVREFMNKDVKSVDELLNDTIDDTIELDYREPKELMEETREYLDFGNPIDEELDRTEDSLEVLDELPKKRDILEDSIDEEKEDTLENDLFDLIDSMYENREEE